MKTNYLILCFIISLFSLTANSQITKGNWMIGGDAKYSTFRARKIDGSGKYSTLFIKVNPNVGYFIKDKIVIGGILEMRFINGGSSYILTPFFRYYLLKPDKIVNIFSSVSAGYGIQFVHSANKNYNISKFGFKLGSVVFLNPNIGLEFLASYQQEYHQRTKRNMRNGIQDYFDVGFGLQIHLENNR